MAKRKSEKKRQPETTEFSKADHGYALAAAYTNMLIENPDTVLRNRGPSMAVYDELLRDDQVKSCFQQRRSALTSATWSMEPASDSAIDKAVAEFQQEQLERVGWDDVTDKMLYGVFYGYAVAESMFAITEDNRVGLSDIKVRDRSRFRWSVDDQLLLMGVPNYPRGKPMPDFKFWTYSAGASHHDNPYGQGLAHSLYWPVFFKRNDIKFWLVFLEKFGMPTTAVRLPDGQISDPVQVGKAKEVLSAIQQDSGIVVPDSMVVELIEAARSGTADYDKLVARMDAAISKVILSQTMTTDDGSSRSQAEVHSAVADAVTDADADLIADSYRRSIGTWLTEWNFPGATPPHIVRNTEPEEDLSKRAERDGMIHKLGYNPTPDYIEETYGAGWEKREAQPVDPQLMNTGRGPMPAEFAELSSLLQKRAGHREDQQLIADAAGMLGTKYRELLGDRVDQLLAYLEDSDDFATFSKHLTTLLGEPAPEAAVETVQRATIVGRLMGMLRGQRD